MAAVRTRDSVSTAVSSSVGESYLTSRTAFPSSWLATTVCTTVARTITETSYKYTIYKGQWIQGLPLELQLQRRILIFTSIFNGYYVSRIKQSKAFFKISKQVSFPIWVNTLHSTRIFCAYLCLQRFHFIYTDVKFKLDFLSLDNITQNKMTLTEQRNQHSEGTIHRGTLNFSRLTNTH